MGRECETGPMDADCFVVFVWG